MPTQKQLIEVLITEIASLKRNLPNGNIIRIEEAIIEMKENQEDMKKDISDIKKTILDPEEGLVVRINKNTEFREERENKIPFYEGKLYEFESLKNWKNSVSKALWFIYSAIIGMIIKLLFF